ncbi:hypothetical protein ABZU76_44135 [Amycolatopsis sp. NPDC005232]|uniref:hypothetical protein n=1 Tax=Amycolatopsis sp. NPDC005232 TaxID=3157027 RepID=UPI0033ACEB4E
MRQAGVALFAILASVLSGWAMWPWAGALGALIVLALSGARLRLDPVYTLAAALLVTDVWFLATVNPSWWAVLAGTVVTGAATLNLRLRTRRRETLGALALGMLLAGGITGLLVDAALARADAERDLQAAHHAAVPRILPHTPGAMVAFLVERIGHPTPGNVADACLAFSPHAQQQLAAAHHAEDVLLVLQGLHLQITPPRSARPRPAKRGCVAAAR